MMSISTEDKWCNCVEISRGGSFGLYLITALLALVIACSVAITQPYISDTDASTYIIMPLLMLPVSALFMLKRSSSLRPAPGPRSIALGIAIFILLIALSLDLRAWLGPAFFSYRVDTLLLPLAVLSLAVLIYGYRNLRAFAWLAVYAAFASPVILLPLINSNLGFASLNTLAVYYPAKLALPNLSFSAPITLRLGINNVAIGNSCIGIGALIGLVMLLIPVAYLLDGSMRSKVLWVAIGAALLIALNYLRLLAIAFAWFFYGPSNSILGVHSVAGQIIFYLTIIVTLLLARWVGLSYPRSRPSRQRSRYGSAGVAAAVAFSIVYFALTLSYLSASSVPLQSLGQNPDFTWGSAPQLHSSYISFNGAVYAAMGMGNRSIALVLENATGPGSSAIALFADKNSTAERDFAKNASSAWQWKEYLNGPYTAYLYRAQNNTVVYHSTVPYRSGAETYLVDMYVIGITAQGGSGTCISPYGYFYDLLANLAQLNTNTFNGRVDSSYCFIKNVVS